MNSKTFLCLSLFICSIKAEAQHQEREVLLYNLSFGAITSGIGSVINKPKTTNWKKAFIRGVWQGASGGLVNYTGKKTLYLINKKQNGFYVLPAKLLHAAGSSIIENAAAYRPFLKNWNIDYGPVRFDYAIGEKLRVRFLPETLYAVAQTSRYSYLDVKNSLLSGLFVFKTHEYLYFGGKSEGRAIFYSDSKFGGYNEYQIMAHEYVHTFQYKEYQVFNMFFNPMTNKIKSKGLRKIFTNYVYFDVPYITPFYELEGRYPNYRYFKNFFEFEAQRFSTNRMVGQRK